MEITYLAASAQCYGKCYVDSTGKIKIRDKSDYIRFKNVDFGDGMRGVEIVNTRFHMGTALAEIRIDKPDGYCIGVIACTATIGKTHLHVNKAEIEETKGMHDVYITFSNADGSVHSVRFLKNSPYDTKCYTPIDNSRIIDVQADTWEATDMLGRKIPSPEDCPAKRDKLVGMFYHNWHENNVEGKDGISIVETLEKYPEAEYDMDHHGWDRFYAHWHEPLFGYYRASDPYVIRKHLIMLANAGVDFITFDLSNQMDVMHQATFAMLEGMRNAKLEGINVPKITFLMSFCVTELTYVKLYSLYQDLYKPGLYEDLWFKIDGKPVIMGYGDSVPDEGLSDVHTQFLHEMKNFFTFRPCQPWYAKGQDYPNQWGWLESSPQHKFCERPDGSCEQMTVGTAQNRTKELMCSRFNIVGSYGRSYTNKDGHSLMTKDSYKYGYNFQEQWDYALEADPDIIFVSNWNEWTAGRFKQPWVFEEDSDQVGYVDEFDREHSRDIEPDCDGYLDTFYLQLCANVRKFKGTAKVEKASGEKTIDITAEKEQWAEITPEYRNHRGSTPRRDYPGYGDRLRLVNRSGRNDIVSAKVARDENKIYFCAQCISDIMGTGDENCMTLFIDIDRNKETGWEGYDFRVCGDELQKCLKDRYLWETVAKVDKNITGSFVQLAINKVDLGLGKTFDLEFKWSDNNFPEYSHKTADVMDFYTNGCSAPFGRFNYRYKTDK